MNNDFKQKLQEREFAVLKDQHRVILKWATGCGKSKMVIDLINYAVDYFSNKPVRILFLVAERAHIQNWEDEFGKWHLKRDKISTDIACYASLKKYKDFAYDMVVMDEAHHVFSEKRMAALEVLKDNLRPDAHIYLLSATLPSSKEDMIEDIFGEFTVSTVTLKDAIADDILPDPKVYVVGMELDNKRHNQLIKIGKDESTLRVKWEDRFKYIRKSIPCNVMCTQRQKYQYYTETMDYWKERYTVSKNEYHHNLWVNTGSTRKRFLGEQKSADVYRFLNTMPANKRYVCFCASVAQASMLGGRNTISSKKRSSVNQDIIDAFNQKRINSIYAVGMITEGMNLNDIQVGIIVQLDGKERLFVQKFGRICRADHPVLYIFYYKNTQDETYLKSALENIEPEFVKYCTLDELWKIVK